MSRWGIILAGGVGSRFWPLSTPARPKQLLSLVDSDPLLVNTLKRLAPIVPAQQTLVLTTESLRAAICDAAPSLPPNNVIAEPRLVGTAGALAWAAAEIARRAGEDAVMICLHSDWAIGDDNAFRETLLAAERVAITERALVTVGVVPTRADPGFGYIQPGDATETGALKVRRFVEKPPRERAEWMLHQGYLWNSGIFVWRVGDFLEEINALTPEVSRALALIGDGADRADRYFSAVIPISVDVGVLERSSKVRVVAGDFGWDDVGTWGALRRVKPEDETGNVSSGSVYAVDAVGNVVHAEEGTVVLYGVSDLVVVTKAGITLVTTTDRSADLKALVESLPEELREPL